MRVRTQEELLVHALEVPEWNEDVALIVQGLEDVAETGVDLVDNLRVRVEDVVEKDLVRALPSKHGIAFTTIPEAFRSTKRVTPLCLDSSTLVPAKKYQSAKCADVVSRFCSRRTHPPP